MPNEDIITALKNSLEHGESLQDAINILINSGYNPSEVQEASRFIGYNSSTPLKKQIQRKSLPSIYPNPNEILLMPEKKSFLSKMNLFKGKEPKLDRELEEIRPMKIEKDYKTQSLSELPVQNISSETQETNPEKIKQSFTKEIILLVILLILVGVLILTIVFRDAILGWFS